MGKRARAARPEAAAQPLKCHRSEHAQTARRAPHFLALPDAVINILFDKLSPNPGTTGTGSRDALNLAATCRSLNEYYRHAFIVALDLSARCHYSSDVVLRAFERLSRVHTIDNLQGSWRPGGALHALIGVGTKRDALQSRAQSIKSLCLGESHGRCSDGIVSTECVRSIAQTYRNLEYLALDCACFAEDDVDLKKNDPRVIENDSPIMETDVCLVKNNALVVNLRGDDAHLTDDETHFAEDDGVLAIEEHLSNSLQTLILQESSKMSTAKGAQRSSLRFLKTLMMAHCDGLTDVTFNAFGALEELEELDLSWGTISSAVVCDVLPRLRKLRVLNLEGCQDITETVFSCLPRSLVELKIGSSGAMRAGVPQSALERVPNLRLFEGGDFPEMNDLSFLAPVSSHLQVLRLSEVGVSDSNAARYVSQMPNLLELDLSYTAASDETARAVSSLGKIEEVHLNGTRVGSDGMTALASGVASESLRILKLINCPEISMDDGAVDVLSNKISQRGYGVVSIHTEYADDSDDADDG